MHHSHRSFTMPATTQTFWKVDEDMVRCLPYRKMVFERMGEGNDNGKERRKSDDGGRQKSVF
jgi:hypothetical protein